MKKERNKIRFPRLSVKIILTLFAVFIAVYSVLFAVFAIARAAGLELPRDEAGINNWLRGIVLIIPPAIGAGVIALFAYAVNLIAVARIRKLNNATKEVAKGNYGIRVDTKGKDEISELTESFNRMSAELAANEYLSKEFIRNVSHEFKTPISAIRAYGELLEAEAGNKKPDGAVIKEYAGVIVKESDRLAGLSKSILRLSLLDSTTIIKKDDTFSPAEQIRDILRLMQREWAEKDITLDLRLEEITVTNNAQLLYQVWQNLISNAIKFSNPGGAVTVVLRNGGGGVFFEITDNGAGIKEEDKEKIFDHFFMSDASRNSEGNGLGLAITKKILNKTGGEIGFESKEGEGSRFFVRI